MVGLTADSKLCVLITPKRGRTALRLESGKRKESNLGAKGKPLARSMEHESDILAFKFRDRPGGHTDGF